MPRVSVLMTIYNPGRFLATAIESIGAQTFGDFELIAIENGSSDGSKNVLRDYAAADPRIRLTDLPSNIGRTAALNLALQQSQGEYIAVLDADDVAVPDRLARQVQFLDANPTVTLLASHTRWIDEQGAVLGFYTPSTEPAQLYDALAYSNPFSHSATIFRRAAALSVGGYPREYDFAQDFALWLELARLGQLGMIGEPLADVRYHEGQATLSPSNKFKRFNEALELFRKASTLPGLSVNAQRRGRSNRATYHYLLAGVLWQTGKRPRALFELIRGVGVAPLFCLRRAVAALTRSAVASTPPKPGLEVQ